MIDPDRMFEGIARTLEDSVMPALGSGFARGQLHAVLDVLGGLQGQVGWGGMLLESEADALAELVAAAAADREGPLTERLRGYSNLAAAPVAERVREGRALVCEMIQQGLADSGPLAAAVDAWLANDTIMKAMALRPGRLAEISQG